MATDQHEKLSGPETIEDRWPYDGPHDREQVSEAAAALAALVRYLNNATGAGNGAKTLDRAATAYRVTNNLSAAAWGMDQLLAQLGDALRRQAGNRSLYDDRAMRCRRSWPATSTSRPVRGRRRRWRSPVVSCAG